MRYGKVLIGAGVVVGAAAALYGYAYYKYPPRRAEPVAASTAPAPVPAAPQASPTTEPAAPADRATFDRCVRGGFPTPENAEQRNAECSKAIMTRQLSPDDLALARLIRGSARMTLGDKVMAREDYIEALKRYDALVDSRNPEALALFRRAAAEDALGNTEKALYDYGRAIRLDPTASLAFLGRGVLLATRKRAYERAIEDFNKVLVLEPDNVQALIRRGDAFSQLGDTGRALVDLDRAIGLAPQSTQAYFYRGLVHSRRNETVAALADYNAALERGPHNVDALTSRAAIYSLDGKLGLAIQDLDAAIAIDKENSYAFFNRGFAYFAQAEYQKAIDDYTRAIALDPDFGLAYNNRALARAVLGKDLPQALADCDMALKLLPGNLEVRDTRGFIYLKLGDPALALNEYNLALERDPNRTTALFGSGLAKIRMGDIKAGEGDQAAARTLDPEIDKQFTFYGLD
jgi:tetratricopeptide (TPR) repeat protein